MGPAVALQSDRKTPRQAWFPVAWTVCLAVIAFIAGIYHSFSQRKPFDDEGILMDWIGSFMRGRAPYVDVHAFYGPAYYLYESLAHALLRTSPTATSIRIVSIVFWTTSILLVFALVRRVAQSWVIALAAFLLVFRAGRFMGEEPGHPQELCLLLFLAAAFALTGKWRKPARLLWLGALAGALLCTKINAGALLILPLAAAWILALAPTSIGRVIRVGTAAALLCVAPILFLPNLTMPWAQRLLVVEQFSLVATLIAIWSVRHADSLRVREVLLVVVGAVAITAAMILYAVAHGSSYSAMVEWMILKPRSMGGFWYLAFNPGNAYVAWSAFGVLLSALARTRLSTPARIAAAQMGLGLGVALLAATNRWAAVFCFATPFMWLLTRPSIRDRGALQTFPRNVLALMGPLVSLYVYPVAGVHVRLVDVVLIAFSALILGDGWSYYKAAGNPGIIRATRLLAPATLCLMMALLGFSLMKSRAHYLSLDPLELPGAAGMRLPEDDVRAFREIAAGARNSCSYLFEIPAMPSFNLWTGLPGPSGLPFANVITGLPDDEQRALIESVASIPRSCIVYSPEMVTFWTHNANVSARPIMQFLQRDYHTVLESQGNRLMVRNSP